MANLVVLVVVILGLINGGYCQETTQETPWRIHTLLSVECHNYLFRFSSILQKVVLDLYMCFYSHQFGVLRFAKYIIADLSELNSFMQQYGVSPESSASGMYKTFRPAVGEAVSLAVQVSLLVLKQLKPNLFRLRDGINKYI
ncbi:hypothetical protein LOK49_LG04G03124 [Camellia lanceoleosa]|uniref:Uncharacterized protein n=1 Tax=Camellia lanceoleosa TaxID=1840588 RepID=A0ACC0HZS4_9ERIC|nr:hypothetical protein LOK49_LG04G03124 [Camellia lanceoleosa]